MKFRKKPRIIYNDDSCSLRFVPPPHSEKSLMVPIDYLKNTQVDILCFCLGEEVASSWPSKVIESMFDILRSDVTGVFDAHKTQNVMWSFYQQGIDYLPLLIRNAQRNRIAFYASFRMNDTHHKSDPEGVLAPRFWKENQHLRLWEVTDAQSYYNANLDYSYAQVRKRKTDAIAEVADTYDLDGVELDFCRSPYFFQPSEAWKKRSILTDFVAEVREILGRIGRRRKRPFGLILRTPIDEPRLTTAGIDAGKWIDKKLMDILVMSHLANNYNQRLEPWLGRCRKKGIPLYPSVELPPALHSKNFYALVANPVAPAHNYVFKTDPETDAGLQRGMAANYLTQGADGIYMFNYPCRLFEGICILLNDQSAARTLTGVLSQMGSLRTLARRNRHYIFYEHVPIYVEANRPRRFHQTIPFTVHGSDLGRAAAVIRFRQIARRNPHAAAEYAQDPIVPAGFMNYYLNDQEIDPKGMRRTRQPAGRVPSGFTLERHELLEITVPGKRLVDGTNTLAFEIPRFPRDRDPYIYIHDLEVDLRFGNG